MATCTNHAADDAQGVHRAQSAVSLKSIAQTAVKNSGGLFKGKGAYEEGIRCASRHSHRIRIAPIWRSLHLLSPDNALLYEHGRAREQREHVASLKLKFATGRIS